MISTTVTFSPIKGLLFTISIWLLGVNLSAQDCLDGYVTRDSVNVNIALGSCEILDTEILEAIGLSSCNGEISLSSNRFPLGSFTSVELIEQPNKVIDQFVVSVKPDDSSITNIVSIELSPFDCGADKEYVLDILNIQDDAFIRENIHFIRGGNIITDFIIGDTSYIDRVVCSEDLIYFNDLKIYVGLASTLPNNHTIVHRTGFTTEVVPLEKVLDDYQYFNYTCDFESYTFDNYGPFGFGLSTIGNMRFERALIAQNLRVNVLPPNCPSTLFNIPLKAYQCYLNESDILDTLGFNALVDDYSVIDIILVDGHSMQDQTFTIDRIEVDGFAICTQDILVSYDINTRVDSDEQSFACNDVLNIPLGTECEIELNADVLLASKNVCFMNFILKAEDEAGNIISEGHYITLSEVGTYKVYITDPQNNTTCWSYVNIEDKHIFDVICSSDTIVCVNGLEPSSQSGYTQFPYVGVASEFVPLGNNEYSVENGDLCGIKYARYHDIVEEECSGIFKEILTRYWSFYDSADNEDTCSQKIYILKTQIETVDQFDLYVADCFSDFSSFDSNGHPSPTETGVPTIQDGRYPADLCGTLRKTYSDNVIDKCGRSKKIIREWSIIDWCSDQVITRNQSILIEDTRGPEVIIELDDIELNTHPFLCGAENIELPKPDVVDCGSEHIDMQIFYESISENGAIEKVDNGHSLLIPFINMVNTEGKFDVEYVLTDDCGNVTRDTIAIILKDNQPPVAVCGQRKAISIAGNGLAQVRALTFDDLSVDNCGIQKYEARKLSGACSILEEFSDAVIFCCDEVGQTITVEFKVTDFAGNFNTCLVYVDVYDRFLPVVICPSDITIDCSQDYKDLSLTGMADAIDNCTIDSLYYEDDLALGDCGKGTVIRTWKARDLDNQEVECEQVITIGANEPFVMTADRYPADTVIIGCSNTAGPEFTGQPDLSSIGCADVVATYEDTYFNTPKGGCFKIVRNWIVIDWCEFSSATPNQGKYQMAQAIKVENSIAPDFINLLSDTTICSYGDSCSDEIIINAMAQDDCTDGADLDWFYTVSTDSENPLALKTSTGSIMKANLESGQYIVKFTVSDGCNNYNSQSIRINVQDCKPPMITCSNETRVVILDQNGQGLLFIDDFTISAEDNCSDLEELKFSFSPDTLVNTLLYNCQDIPNGISQIRELPLYVYDLNGNVSSCITYVDLIDSGANLCQDIVPINPDTLEAAGIIFTEELVGVDRVNVSIVGANGQKKHLSTSHEGLYSFDELSENINYIIEFDRSGRADDGVSTLDLLLVQRHILGLGLLNSPYKIIAADVDGNERITGADLVEMRKIILNIDQEFSEQKSWRFVTADQRFSNPYIPFPYHDMINLSELSRDQRNLDMMAMKIGDVNGSNEISSRFKSKSRSEKSATLYLSNYTFNLSDTNYWIPIYSDLKSTLGIQLSMKLDLDNIDFESIEKGQLEVGEDDYYFNEKGELSISWISPTEQEIDEQEPLFFIKVKSKRNESSVDKVISLNENALNPLTINASMEEIRLGLEYIIEPENIDINQPFEVNNIAPNPTTTLTNIQLSVLKNQEIKCRVYDLNGILLQQTKYDLQIGDHSVRIGLQDFQDYSGILIVQIMSEEHSISKKIIKL